MADGVVARRHVPLPHHAPGQPADDAVVLGMHHRQSTVASRGGQHIEDLLVVQTHAVVGHEDLERAHAGVDGRRQVGGQRLFIGVGDDEVEAVVNHRLIGGALVVVGQHLGDVVGAVLRAEGDDGGRAAECGRDRGRMEVVGAHDAEGGHLLDVAVTVHAAGHHQLAARIDLAGAGRQAGAYGRDLAGNDADVGLARVGRRDDGAAADHEIKAHAVLPFFSAASLVSMRAIMRVRSSCSSFVSCAPGGRTRALAMAPRRRSSSLRQASATPGCVS